MDSSRRRCVYYGLAMGGKSAMKSMGKMIADKVKEESGNFVKVHEMEMLEDGGMKVVWEMLGKEES